MATVRDLIRSSLIRINVLDPRQSIGNLDAETGLTSLNALLEQWATEKLLVYGWTPTPFTLIAGQSAYTFGPGADWATTPAAGILDNYAYVTVNGFDYSIQRVDAAQWSQIYWKDFSILWPEFMFVEWGVPNSTISFWPTPSVGYTVTLRIPVAMGNFTLDTVLALPPGYQRALSLSLAEDLAPQYGRQFSVPQQALAARNAIRRRNLVVPQLVAFDPAHG